MGAPVVVAVSHPACLSDTLQLGAYEAYLRGCPLHLLHVAGVTGPDESLLRAADDRVRQAYPALRREIVVRGGDVADAIVATAADAAMLVIGRRPGPLPAERTATLADRLTDAVRCPLVVAAAGGYPVGPVVAAVDETPAAAVPLAFAFEDAALRLAPVRILHAVSQLVPAGGGPGGVSPVLAEAIREVRERYPTVRAELTVSEHPARGALLTATRDARLIVVGKPAAGHHPHVRAIAHTLLRHANCPVAFV